MADSPLRLRERSVLRKALARGAARGTGKNRCEQCRLFSFSPQRLLVRTLFHVRRRLLRDLPTITRDGLLDFVNPLPYDSLFTADKLDGLTLALIIPRAKSEFRGRWMCRSASITRKRWLTFDEMYTSRSKCKREEADRWRRKRKIVFRVRGRSNVDGNL